MVYIGAFFVSFYIVICLIDMLKDCFEIDSLWGVNMYYVISNSGVCLGRSLKDINKKCDSLFEQSEFKSIGSDYVVKLADSDLSFVQDKKRLSLIPISGLYKVDTSKYILYAILLINFIILVKK